MENINENQSVAEVKLLVCDYFTDSLFGPNEDGISLTVTVTNLIKEIRYFEQPSFKPSIPFNENEDAFVMFGMVQPISFPKRLEFGEQYMVSYKLGKGNIGVFRSLLDKDPNATIKAEVSTTLGESSESNLYKVSDIISNYNR